MYVDVHSFLIILHIKFYVNRQESHSQSANNKEHSVNLSHLTK